MTISTSCSEIYYYISSKAGFDPVKTIYLCAPAKEAATVQDAENYAVKSGWQDICEENKAVLVVPTAPNGWENEPSDLLKMIYSKTRNSFNTRSGKAIWGRMGSLWCWETILYLVGEGDGADFAGRALVRCPNVFAATALIGGSTHDFKEGDCSSDHWLIKTPSKDYSVLNKEIPICLWLFNKDAASVKDTIEYYAGSSSSWVRLFEGEYTNDRKLSEFIFKECFEHVIRWKNGPDGTLALVQSRSEFESDPTICRRSITVNGNTYDYYVRLPKGMSREEAKGLPLVYTIHGRGEPVWMFMSKNGWDVLCDETREFVLISPDSPGNIWFLERDGEALYRMTKETVAEFGLDPERVYVTGFSNGGMTTREIGISRPDLFAAISPWNAPNFDTTPLKEKDTNAAPKVRDEVFLQSLDKLADEGIELPCWYYYGDNDPASSAGNETTLGKMLTANGCTVIPDPEGVPAFKPDQILKGEDMLPVSKGYTQPDRFMTYLYKGDGNSQVRVTVMKNMPHGAITDESRAVWAFLKQYRRVNKSRKISLVEDVSN